MGQTKILQHRKARDFNSARRNLDPPTCSRDPRNELFGYRAHSRERVLAEFRVLHKMQYISGFLPNSFSADFGIPESFALVGVLH